MSELRKNHLNQGKRPAFYFWRDSNGNEVDLIIETGKGLMPVEIKAGQTLNRDFFSGLQRWMHTAGDLAHTPTLVYGGTNNTEHNGIQIKSWNRL